MRTSNLLMITAFTIGVAALLLHDSKLKAVYLSKSYRDPLQGFVPLNYKDFTAIDVNAADVANVKIVQGPFKVLVKANQANFIQLSQKNNRLIVDAAFNNNEHLYDRYYEGYRVYISCPSLTALRMNNFYMVDGRRETDAAAFDYFYSRKTILQGFKQDSLGIIQDNGSYLIIDSNNLKTLTLTMGISTNSAPITIIGSGNNIANARLAIRNKSYLQLVSPIPNLQYTLDDSAKLYMTGAVNKLSMKR